MPDPQQIATQAATGAPPQNVQVAPESPVQGGDQELVMQAVQQAIQQSADQNGYVDIDRLVAVWPQVAQELGLNIPFGTVLQMIQSNPQIIQDMVVQMGLSGIIDDGRRVSAEELGGQPNAIPQGGA